VAAARAVQADPEVDKFGDVQLFEALAEDDALCVWHKDGDTAKAPDPQPLIDYARAAQAKFQKRHFKVPAYRHPDALLHPVFCDFGKSRWEIQYSAHKACKGLAKARNRVRKTSEAVRKAEDLLEKARGKKTEAAEEKKLQEARKTLENDEREVARLSDPRQLTMRLWDGQAVARMPLRWQSKRLSADLALEQDQQACERAEVARADRLGRAASDATGTGRVVVSGLFEQNDWNGRLQAPRKQMEAIATRVAEHGWDEKAVRMRGGLQWLVTFSAKLQPQGPWHEYARSFSELAPARPYVAKKGDCAVKHEGNDKRTAKLILSRLRGIRVLSVDLGHRHAAACAVWEAVDAEQVKQACVASGRGGPKERD
jgi:hypothetical protein